MEETMLSRDQQLADATIRYLELLEAGQLTSVRDFVAAVDPELREELAEHLEFVLATGQLADAEAISPAEEAAAEGAAARARARLVLSVQPTMQSLTEARKARKLSSAALAKLINLPVDLAVRIERGGVLAASLPEKLFARLATALQTSADEVRAMLSAPPSASAVRLSAQDGTRVGSDTPLPFAEALAQSAATPAQRAEWSE
jgi:transcriptional regulator with XRE-family HTH domain